jgi:hypothetical protein
VWSAAPAPTHGARRWPWAGWTPGRPTTWRSALRTTSPMIRWRPDRSPCCWAARTGLTTAGAGGAIFHQGTSGIAGVSERFDQFGQTLTSAYLQSSKQESPGHRLVRGRRAVHQRRSDQPARHQLIWPQGERKSNPERRILRSVRTAGYYNYFGVGLS